MTYLMIGVLLLVAALYLSFGYMVFRVIESKNPGIYSDMSRVKKCGLVFLLPLLTIAMAGIYFFIKGSDKE